MHVFDLRSMYRSVPILVISQKEPFSKHKQVSRTHVPPRNRYFVIHPRSGRLFVRLLEASVSLSCQKLAQICHPRVSAIESRIVSRTTRPLTSGMKGHFCFFSEDRTTSHIGQRGESELKSIETEYSVECMNNRYLKAVLRAHGVGKWISGGLHWRIAGSAWRKGRRAGVVEVK